MNANELIEELEDAGSFFEDALYLKSAALLRQQQAEIEALKDELKGWNLAWNETYPPYPAKELTDEEIDEISKEVWERPWLEAHRKFARAILRKAQEK